MARTLVPLALAAAAVAGLLLLPGPERRQLDFPDQLSGLRTAASTLQGEGTRSDFAADYVGARALLRHDDPYPVLGDAFFDVGLDWPLTIRSTHPPTVYALALPFAGFSWQTASALWGFAMLIAIGLSAWAFGAPPAIAAAIAPLALLWAPAAWSIGQVTAIWLLGAALAWRWRERPFLAGLAVGLAAATKILPLVLLAPFLLRRRWVAAAGAAVAIVAALVPVLALYPNAIGRFLEVERHAGPDQSLRDDNGALLALAWERFGAVGFAVAVLLLLGVAVTAAYLTLTERKLRFESYALWLWLSVALLPIVWVYSLLPLAPALLFALRSRWPTAALAAVALVLPMAVRPFRPDSAPLLTAMIVVGGLALLMAASAELTRLSGRQKPAANAPTSVP
jgi:alpha-1,2-mannosyltransferase